MSKKNRDEHNRWRNKTVAFRMSPEEAQLLDDYVKLSGLNKQDYIISRVLQRDVIVKGNPRVYKALRNELMQLTEATPHLHIDFIPFTTNSKRGLDTRVSMKQALSSQGFKGGTREETEWSQWVNSEKHELSKVMLEHNVEWEYQGKIWS